MRLSESIDKIGYFWLPSTPDTKVSGRLNISKSGQITLDVTGLLEPLASMFQTQRQSKHLNGILENGKAITLEKCHYKNQTLQVIAKSTVSSLRAYIGTNYNDCDEVSFSKVSFSLEGLDQWLSIRGINVKYASNPEIDITFTPPPPILIKLADDLNLEFSFTWTGPSPYSITDAQVTQSAYVSLLCATPKPFSYFATLLPKILNFFCFSIDESIQLTSLTGYSNNILTTLPGGKSRPVPIEIFFSGFNSDKPAPKISKHNMLLSYGDIAPELQRLLTNWLANYEISEPAFNLYFAAKADAHAYLDGRFLSFAQGIETLHRRNSTDTTMSHEEFQALIKTLSTACPSEKRQWLSQKLHYANELPLRERLNQILEPFQQYFGNQDACKAFIAKVINTRNYLTHYDPELSTSTASPQTLWELCMKLEALFQLHFLRLMGFNIEEIKRILKDNVAFQNKLKGNSV